MKINTLEELKQKFAAANEEKKAEIIFGSEELASEDLIDFLLQAVADSNLYDLARIEAIKSVGLAGLKVESRKRKVVDMLIEVSLDDDDDDIRSYALQSLNWYVDFNDIPNKIEPLLAQTSEAIVRDAALSVLLSQKSNPESIVVLRKLEEDPEIGAYIKQELGTT